MVRVGGGAAADARLPLVVALHGYGDSPENFVGLYSDLGLRVRVVALAGPIAMGDGHSWFPMRTEVPPAVWNQNLHAAAQRVVREIARLANTHPTCGLPVVSGFSQGGMLSYAVVAEPGAGVIAAMPLGGFLPRELWPSPRAVGGLLPGVYAFHGTADARVALADDRAASEAFRARGYRAELRTYEGVGHSVPPPMVADLRAKLAEVFRGQGCPVE